MSNITKQDTNGVKPLLGVGEFGYDNYPAGGDVGRVFVGTGSANIALAKKSEVDTAVATTNAHTVRVDNPHAVTKAQVGLSNADNTSDNVKNVLSATKWTTARTITLNGDVSGSVSVDGSANVTITTSVQPNSIALGTDTSGNYVAGLTQGTGISVTGTAGESWSPTVSLTNVGTAGTYRSVTTDAQGRVIAGTNPTTVNGYGLTDVYTKTEVNSLIPTTLPASDVYAWAKASTKPEYTASEVGLGNVTNESKSTMFNNPTFTGTPIAPTAAADTSTTQLATTAFVQETVGNKAVVLTGDQTIAGIKTFSSSPIVPTPTTNFQVATKQYVDEEIVGVNNYTDTRVNEVVGQLSTDYYQGPYGISWDYATDTYIRTGAKGYTAIQSQMRRCVLNVDGSVKYYLHPENSNFKADGTPSVLTGADGNVMVEVPKHYVKVETVGNVDSFSISLTQEPGYVLDPAFLKWNGTEMVEVPYRYFRAYEGFVSGGKLLSVSGVTPTRSQTIATFRTQAMANGVGWHLTDWNLLNTIKRLCYIEFCDFIVTKYLGNGNDTGSDYGITTGQSNALGNRSSNSTHNDKYMSYRGIENMYADIWEFVDGININNYQAHINQKWSTFASDVFTGDYVSKGTLIAAGASNSLIKRCNVSVDGGFIPTVIGGSTTTFYGDALWSATGAKVALYGGYASNGSSDGLGALIVTYASSDSNVGVGAAVCR